MVMHLMAGERPAMSAARSVAVTPTHSPIVPAAAAAAAVSEEQR